MDSRSHRRTSRGITLLELVTVMTIVAILMAIAIPSYKYVTNGNRIAAEVNGLLGDMQYARAEAIKEGQTVTVCASSNGTSCLAATTTTWNTGWIVFSDVNGDHAVEAQDAVLRVQSGFTSTDTFTSNNTVGYVTFNREGFATGTNGIATGVLITLHAAPASAASTRCLSLTMVGLMTVQTYNTTSNGMTCL
jgi:type IV fimbrial biogenesis protein FimT